MKKLNENSYWAVNLKTGTAHFIIEEYYAKLSDGTFLGFCVSGCQKEFKMTEIDTFKESIEKSWECGTCRSHIRYSSKGRYKNA